MFGISNQVYTEESQKGGERRRVFEDLATGRVANANHLHVSSLKLR